MKTANIATNSSMMISTKRSRHNLYMGFIMWHRLWLKGEKSRKFFTIRSLKSVLCGMMWRFLIPFLVFEKIKKKHLNQFFGRSKSVMHFAVVIESVTKYVNDGDVLFFFQNYPISHLFLGFTDYVIYFDYRSENYTYTLTSMIKSNL